MFALILIIAVIACHTVAPSQDTQPTAPVLPVQPELNRTYPLRLESATRGVRLLVNNAALLGEYGVHKAPPGKALLVLGTEWENVIPLTYLAEEKQALATTYKIPNLADHIYLVLDGRRAARLDPEADNLPGHVPVKTFALERLGDRIRGNLVFPVLAGARLGWAEIRFYDFAHGHMVIGLGDPEEATARGEAKPIGKLAKNEVVEAGVFELAKPLELGGQEAPPGMQLVSLDFRARSLFTTESDATAFDPKARPGQKTRVGTVADWTDSRKYLQLVVDGEYGYVPDPSLTELVEQPRFLPDVMTGGRVVFLAPKDVRSLELRCDFPNARTPSGQVIRPAGFSLPVEGKQPPLPNRKPIARIEDGVFLVSVTNHAPADTFGGQKAPAGKRFVVLDVTVNNRGQNGEAFQTEQQLKMAGVSGQQAALDPATYQGVHCPAPHVWIPVREQRSFQVAYLLDESETRPRLAYTGVSKAEVVELGALAPSAARPAPGTVARPDAKPARPAEPPPAASSDALKPLEVKGKRFPSRVPVRPNLEPRGIAGVGLTAEQVNGAIDKGAAFLWDFIKTEDMGKKQVAFGNQREHLLVALALVHAGAHKKHGDFDAELRKFLGKFDPFVSHHSYEVGLYCMTIESYADPVFLPGLRRAAHWLIETQGPEGSWGYGLTVDPGPFAGEDQQGKVLRVQGGQPLDGSDVARPIARVMPREKGADGDNSVSQYAILGLHAASQSRIKASPDVWRMALRSSEQRQDKADGGWAYRDPSVSYGSMTCAGICALALARHELDENQPEIEARIERGLAWLNAHFAVDKHPGSNDWLYYYLYSVERVGRILDTEFIGDHEWYPQGARLLVDQQKENGAWIGRAHEEDPRLATSFALLYLTRATASLAEPRRTGPGILRTAVTVPPSIRVHIVLDATGTMMAELGGRMKFDIAKEAVATLIKELPSNAEAGLRAFGHRKRAIEKGADEDTELLIPLGRLDKDKFLERLVPLRARGKTPLARTILEAKGDVARGSAKDPINVVFLTDGAEDNTRTRPHPIAAAGEFGELKNVRLHIVGFDIGRPDYTEQLMAITQAARGQYYAAADGEALLRELRTAIFQTPDGFAVFDEAAKQVAAGEFGDSVQLPPGKYRIRATYGSRAFEESLWINAGTTTAVTFVAINADGASPQAVQGQAGVPAARKQATPQTSPRAKPAARFCTSCGASLKEGVKFCSACGTRSGS
jgi:Mg-chelatase subunit ChlD